MFSVFHPNRKIAHFISFNFCSLFNDLFKNRSFKSIKNCYLIFREIEPKTCNIQQSLKGVFSGQNVSKIFFFQTKTNYEQQEENYSVTILLYWQKLLLLLEHTTRSSEVITRDGKSKSNPQQWGFQNKHQKLTKIFLAAKLVPYSRASNTRRGCGC